MRVSISGRCDLDSVQSLPRAFRESRLMQLELGLEPAGSELTQRWQRVQEEATALTQNLPFHR